MLYGKDKKGVTRKLTKTGEYTYYITLPKAYIEELGWCNGQKVAIKLSGKKVVIADWKP